MVHTNFALSSPVEPLKPLVDTSRRPNSFLPPEQPIKCAEDRFALASGLADRAISFMALTPIVITASSCLFAGSAVADLSYLPSTAQTLMTAGWVCLGASFGPAIAAFGCNNSAGRMVAAISASTRQQRQ